MTHEKSFNECRNFHKQIFDLSNVSIRFQDALRRPPFQLGLDTSSKPFQRAKRNLMSQQFCSMQLKAIVHGDAVEPLFQTCVEVTSLAICTRDGAEMCEPALELFILVFDLISALHNTGQIQSKRNRQVLLTLQMSQTLTTTTRAAFRGRQRSEPLCAAARSSMIAELAVSPAVGGARGLA